MARRVLTEEDFIQTAQTSPAPMAAHAYAATPTAPVGPPAPPAMPPSVAIPPPPEGSRKGRMNYALVGAMVALALVAGVASFFIGQSTRASDDDVRAQLTANTQQLNAQKATELRDQARLYRERIDRKVRTASRSARSSGRRDGYQSGVSDGRSTGYSSGVTAGRQSGFLQGTCYTPVTFAYVC